MPTPLFFPYHCVTRVVHTHPPPTVVYFFNDPLVLQTLLSKPEVSTLFRPRAASAIRQQMGGGARTQPGSKCKRSKTAKLLLISCVILGPILFRYYLTTYKQAVDFGRIRVNFPIFSVDSPGRIIVHYACLLRIFITCLL